MSQESTIYFPLGGNAAALTSGPGAAAVRRRILAAALLHDFVILEPGVLRIWAGPTGAGSFKNPTERPSSWQTLRERGAATRAQFHVGVRRSSAPESTPFRQMVGTTTTIAWSATYEPFRRELPASAAEWLDYGAPTDEAPANALVSKWESADRLERLRRYYARGQKLDPDPPGGEWVESTIVKATYLDLAISAVTGSAVSIDRRHQLAVQRRITAGDAQVIGGHRALELLLPVGFGWEDVSGLRGMDAIQDYRAVIRDVEADALDGATSIADLQERIQSGYREAVARATARGLPMVVRVAVAVIGFALGEAVQSVAASAAGAVAGFALAEAGDEAMKPRWLSVHRRVSGRPPEGI